MDNDARLPRLLADLKRVIDSEGSGIICEPSGIGLKIEDNRDTEEQQTGGMSTAAELTEDGDILLILRITPPIPIKYESDARNYLLPLCDEYDLIFKEAKNGDTMQFGVAVRFRWYRDKTALFDAFDHNYTLLGRFNAEQATNIGRWLAKNEL
ncbi:MAG: hypothetical protein SFZ02_11520 [bacterium]|nr:hypothetical protein [bacterium]